MDSTSYIFANVNNILVLNGTNFKKWKEHVMIVLGCMDLDYALKKDCPIDLLMPGLLSKGLLWKNGSDPIA
ncbi:hypothetical protein CK203_048596 [Vitis vinifera]|uniref:Uncharacterized protein n=1 Tax=Vitis vinifera TaxID=29760 RepID=A0A438HK72_VITVI|nr:hypothetical protein CK203_048596 [Vitis vinifera]